MAAGTGRKTTSTRHHAYDDAAETRHAGDLLPVSAPHRIAPFLSATASVSGVTFPSAADPGTGAPLRRTRQHAELRPAATLPISGRRDLSASASRSTRRTCTDQDGWCNCETDPQLQGLPRRSRHDRTATLARPHAGTGEFCAKGVRDWTVGGSERALAVTDALTPGGPRAALPPEPLERHDGFVQIDELPRRTSSGRTIREALSPSRRPACAIITDRRTVTCAICFGAAAQRRRTRDFPILGCRLLGAAASERHQEATQRRSASIDPNRRSAYRLARCCCSTSGSASRSRRRRWVTFKPPPGRPPRRTATTTVASCVRNSSSRSRPSLLIFERDFRAPSRPRDAAKRSRSSTRGGFSFSQPRSSRSTRSRRAARSVSLLTRGAVHAAHHRTAGRDQASVGALNRCASSGLSADKSRSWRVGWSRSSGCPWSGIARACLTDLLRSDVRGAGHSADTPVMKRYLAAKTAHRIGTTRVTTGSSSDASHPRPHADDRNRTRSHPMTCRTPPSSSSTGVQGRHRQKQMADQRTERASSASRAHRHARAHTTTRASTSAEPLPHGHRHRRRAPVLGIAVLDFDAELSLRGGRRGGCDHEIVRLDHEVLITPGSSASKGWNTATVREEETGSIAPGLDEVSAGTARACTNDVSACRCI